MHAERGVYAVLLAAGASIGAAMPTAWDIVRDLIRQEMEALGEPLPTDPADLDAWYSKTHGLEPSYSTVVEAVAPTPASQRELLQRYFTPSDTDIANGQRVPSPAHHALAALAKAGHIQVFLTTNFDDLLERALDQANVTYVTVTDETDVRSAIPLVRGGVQIVKLHGDYLKANVRNGLADLTVYPEALAEHLRRIVEDYGLIVAGWSAVWDHALRDALTGALSRRYPVVWAEPFSVSPQARAVINFRQAKVVEATADEFFPLLHRRVQALDDSTYVAPLTTALIEGEVKQALRDPAGARQRLIDLTDQLAERLDVVMQGETLPNSLTKHSPDKFLQVEAAVLPLLTVIGTLTRYDPGGAFAEVVQDALSRTSLRPPIDYDHHTAAGVALRHLPAALTLYSGALVATATRNFHYLQAILNVRYYPPATRTWDHIESFASLTTVAAQQDVKVLYPGSHPQTWVGASRYLRSAAQRAMQRYLNPRMLEMDINVAEMVVAYAVEATKQQGLQTYMDGGVWRGMYLDNLRGQPYIDHLRRVFEGDMILARLLGVEGVSLLDGIIWTALRQGGQQLGSGPPDSLVGVLNVQVKGRL